MPERKVTKEVSKQGTRARPKRRTREKITGLNWALNRGCESKVEILWTRSPLVVMLEDRLSSCREATSQVPKNNNHLNVKMPQNTLTFGERE